MSADREGVRMSADRVPLCEKGLYADDRAFQVIE